MKKLTLSLILFSLSLILYAQREPANNIGKSLSTMKQEFPELRFIKSDQKGNQYEDGYPQDGIAMFFYFNNNRVTEECMICQSNDGFPQEWYRSLYTNFNRDWYTYLRTNTRNHKEYVFTDFTVDIIYVSENGQNTAMIVYSKKNVDGSQQITANGKRFGNQATPPISRKSTTTDNKKLEWYEIDYTENKNDVYGMQAVGSFSAKSSPVVFGSRTYSDAFHSALKKLQKKAAKKGARILLITYKSSMNTDFLTVKVEAIGYK